MSGRIYAEARWEDGPRGSTPLEEPGRRVMGTLAGWLEAAKARLGLETGVEAGRDDAHARAGHVDPAELARHEEIRLVQRVFMTPGVRAPRTVVFAGVEHDNGCADVCVRAGQTLAQLKLQSVCVVDANLRAPVLHRVLGTDNQDGFAVAVEQAGFTSTFPQRVTPENLWLLPSGSSRSEPELLLTTDRLRPQVRELGAMFDHVLVNAPPINVYAESLALSQCVDGVVLVLQAHATRREIARNVKAHLEDLSVPLLGVVLNSRTFPIPDVVYRLL